MSEAESNEENPVATLTPQEAKANLEFLARCDIKGAESDAMTQVKMKLSFIMQGRPMPLPANVTDLAGHSGSSKKG
jgi:hypothetical protein